MIRILIADDHPIFRRGLALTLAEAGDLEVCGEAASAEEAMDLAARLTPDVVLLDLSMPGGGLTALDGIRRAQPELPVAVLTASEDNEDVMRALRAGARGYILKGLGSRALVEAVRDIAHGESYVAPKLAARILSEIRMDAEAPSHDPADSERGRLLAQLTPREEQVLELVAAGLSNKEIARRHDMQEKTVKHHMTHILQKLHARNRTEAAMILRGELKRGDL
ncbi:response regulator [Paenirhodobacter populi]|uniref:Response regulator transcription factor n=1 Tax=Paenirhodobacter populi TaxID=2306993 RepID=A0A443JGG0_9RHOB|nr:response regulator transcription factor [Sinirhodobacter populi]RWR19483.1 response regulator transcription factor [Sinirhodobacter populi]